MDPIHPKSFLTSIAYLLVGLTGWVFHPDPVGAAFAISMFMLCLGTAARHWRSRDWTHTFDHAGMHAVFATILAVAVGAGNWTVLGFALLAAILLEVIVNFDLNSTMGVYSLTALMAVYVQTGWFLAVVALVLLGGGFLVGKVWGDDRDGPHAVWHLMTATGIGVLFFSLV